MPDVETVLTVEELRSFLDDRALPGDAEIVIAVGDDQDGFSHVNVFDLPTILKSASGPTKLLLRVAERPPR